MILRVRTLFWVDFVYIYIYIYAEMRDGQFDSYNSNNSNLTVNISFT